MARKKRPDEQDKLFDPATLSPSYQRLWREGCTVNRDDSGTRIFFERVTRAIRRADFGTSRNGLPLYQALLFAETYGGKHIEAAPLKPILETLAQCWLGPTHDGSAPLTIIPCAQYGGWNPYPAIRELTQPPHHVGTMTALSPLAQYAIENPHRYAKAGHELVPLERWMHAFSQKLAPQLDALRERYPDEIQALFAKINAEQEAIEEQWGPFFSLVVFENIDLASEIFFAEVILPILRTGCLHMPHGEVTDFSRSVVILTAQDVRGDIPRSGDALGFVKEESGESRLKRFLDVRHKLLHTNLREVVASVGDELILIGPRSRETQWLQLKEKLNRFQGQLEQHGILVSFTPAFCEWLLAQARERLKGSDDKLDGNVWTDASLEAALDRYVRDTLAFAAESQKLFHGATLVFDVAPELAAQRSRNALRLRIPSAPAQNPLSPAMLRRALETFPQKSFPDTDMIQRLNQAVKEFSTAVCAAVTQQPQTQAPQPDPDAPSASQDNPQENQ